MGSVADPHAFGVPAAIIGIGNAAVFEPAAWAGRRWWLVVAGTAVAAVGDCAADQAADNACSQSAGNRSTIIVAAVFAIGRWGRAATVVARTIGIVLRGSGAVGREDAAGGNQRGKGCKNDLLDRKSVV